MHLSVYLFFQLSIHLSFCWQHQKRSNSAGLSHFLQLKISKTKQFCETSFKNGKLTVQLTASYQCVLRFFHAMSLKYCACHEKVSPGHTKCCTCHEKASWHSWWFDTPKCNPSQEISSLSSEHLCWRCLLYCACHEKCLFKSPTPAILFFEILQHPQVLVTFQWMHNPPHLPHKTTSERPKCLRDPQFLTLFDFEMCFAPQRRALFRHLNFQKCSETASF